MHRFLRKLLNLQPGEGRKLLVLYLLGLIIATSLVWGKAIGRGLFLKRVGVEWLPLMFVFDGLLALPITLVYTAVVDRVENARLMSVIFGGTGVVLLAGWGLLLADQWGVTIPFVIVVYGVFYLAERGLRALLAVHAWTLFNDYLDIRAAKRLFPILGSGSRVAGTLGGALVAALVGFVSAQNLILAWVGVLAVGVWFSLRIPRWLAADRQSPAAAPTRKGQSTLAAYWENLRGGVRFVSASSFLKALAVGAFAMTLLLALTDYQAQRIFDQTHATAEGLIGFYGLLDGLINLIALPVQMFLISRLVSWLGVAQVNLVFPFGSLLIYAALSLWPGLASAMAGQFSADTFRSSVQVPVDNMLYNAVPLPVKGRARAFIKGLLLPFATVAVGLVLLPIKASGALPYWVLAIGGAAALVQLGAAFLVRRRYTQALVTMLAEEDFSAYRAALLAPAGSEMGPPDPFTFQRLLKRLETSEDEDFTLFLAQIVAEVGGREGGQRLVEIAETASPSVRAAILETLLETDSAGDSALDLCRASLDADDSRLRRVALAVLERLMGADNPDLWLLAAPLLDDPDPETRLPAILLLVRSGDFFYLAEAVRSLHELLADEAHPRCRVAGLRVLEAMGDARMVRNLAHYLDDADDRVRLQAARAIETLADPAAPDWAVSLARQAVARALDDPAEAVRLSALRILGKVGGEGALERLVAALSDPSEWVRKQAEQGLLALDRAAVPALERRLDAEGASEREQYAAAIVLGKLARSGAVSGGDAQRHTRQLQTLFELVLRRIYADMRLVAALDELGPAAPPASGGESSGLDALLAVARRKARSKRPADGNFALARALLRDGLLQRNERRLEVAFRLLGATLRGDPASVEVIARALLGSAATSPARANALEALESLTSARKVRLVGRLTPWGAAPLAELVAAGQEEWNLPALDAEEGLATVLGDADRWLAAIGIVLAGEARTLDAATLREVWWPVWQADPDPAVQEAAHYTARKLALEVEMVDTTEMALFVSLSAVERAIFLKQVPFFAGMTVDQLRTLAGIAEEQHHEEGAVIYAEGDPGEALYVVVNGRVGIEREPKQGRVQRLETLRARQYFGERTIFDGSLHENRAVALDRVHLLAIRREPLLALIRRAPDLSLSLVTVLSQRLRDADDQLAAKTVAKPDQIMRLYDKLTDE